MGLFDSAKSTVASGINKVVPKPVQKLYDPLNILGSDYQQNQGKRDAERAAYLDQSLSAAEQKGAATARLGYGQGLEETGQDIQRLKKLQTARTEGSDPVSEAIRGQKAGAMATASRNLASSGVKGGAAAGAIDTIGRARDADIASSLYQNQRTNILDERDLASNMLSGTTSLMQGNKAEAIASNIPNPPQQKSVVGTVICTELYAQGYYTSDMLLKDVAYGMWVRDRKPHVYVGYRMWADYVVLGMRKSKLFSRLIAMVAVPWAKDMAGEYNLGGRLVSIIGEPICGILGKIKIKLTGAKYVQVRS